MFTVRQLRQVPPNFGEFQREIGDGLGQLFGSCAREEYEAVARETLERTLAHPSVYAYTVNCDTRAVGLLVAISEGGRVRVPFYHVLSEVCGSGAEAELVQVAVSDLRNRGYVHIVGECLTFGNGEFTGAFVEQGFWVVERDVMVLQFSGYDKGVPKELGKSIPFSTKDFDNVGKLLAEVYAEHADRPIHIDLVTEDRASRFVQGVGMGVYGVVHPQYLRGIWREGRLVGAILGCELSGDCGFVLHLAVHPAFQGQGIGTRLLDDLLWEFYSAGLAKVALVVTHTNRAKNLYSRVGFEVRCTYPVFIWQKGVNKG